MFDSVWGSDASMLPAFVYQIMLLFRCRHWNTPVVEGKSYCPDCGEGVVFRWAVLRCRGCHTRRPACYRLRQVTPIHRHCLACGLEDVEIRYLDNPEYFQLRYAMLSLAPDPYAITPDLFETCKAWFRQTVSATTSWSEAGTSRLLTTSGV